jgi:hypothetical protein
MFDVNTPRQQIDEQRQQASERSRQEMAEALLQDSPPMNVNGKNLRNDPAVTERDWSLLRNFHEALEKDTMQTCVRCNERRFDMNVTIVSTLHPPHRKGLTAGIMARGSEMGVRGGVPREWLKG